MIVVIVAVVAAFAGFMAGLFVSALMVAASRGNEWSRQ